MTAIAVPAWKYRPRPSLPLGPRRYLNRVLSARNRVSGVVSENGK